MFKMCRKPHLVYIEVSKFILFAVLMVLVTCSSSQNNTETTTTDSPSEFCSVVTGCECTDMGSMVNIVCDNGTNFDGLQKLTDIFGTKKSYEMAFKGIEVVPPSFIWNLNVSTLIFNDSSIKVISVDAFNGTIALSKLKILQSSIEIIPDFRYVAGTLELLNIDGNKLTSIELEVQNLTNLKELSFRHNLIRTVDERALLGLSNLRNLDLSSNLLTSLPPHLLDGLSNLKSLILSSNQLLSVRGLLSNVRPSIVFLDHNNLTNASEIFSEFMPEVEVVRLSYNPLKTIEEQTFNKYIPKVQNLYLDNCSLTNFDLKIISRLSKLRSLNLMSNLIEHVPKAYVNFSSSLELYFDDNRISSFEAELSFIVRVLHLSGNRLRQLGTILRLTQISQIEVNRNQLEAILEDDLKGVHDTRKLTFLENLISRIDSRAFQSLRNDLEYLDLSSNRLRDLNDSVSYLSRLKILNVSHNSIEKLRKGEFLGLNELQKIYLENNKIVVLQGQLQSLPKLQELMVQFNNLTTVNVQQLPKFLTLFYYQGNPIKCNCQFLPFLKWLNNTGSPQVDNNYCEQRNASQRSAELDTQVIGYNIFSIETCPLQCKCFCSQDANDSFLSVDCSSLGIVDALKPFRKDSGGPEMQFERFALNMWENVDSGYSLMDRVLAVNLEDNDINSMDNWTFPKNLRALELANNQLTELPSSIMSLPFLRWMSLSGNPWSCNCESLNFKKWVISKMSGIEDVNDTRCASEHVRRDLRRKLLIDLSDIDLCPVALGLYIMVVFVVLRRNRLTCCKRRKDIRQTKPISASGAIPRGLILLALIQGTICASDEVTTSASPYERCIKEIGCECVDLDQIIGVMCNNFTDFEFLRKKLSDVSIFGPSPPATYEINLSGIQAIPPQVIKDLIVFHLILDDPSIETISDEAFDGVGRLRRFRIRISSVRKVPNFQKVTHSLRNINVDSSLITEIGQELHNLTLLVEISFRNNSLRTIAEDAFAGMPVLQTLDLSRNKLTVLPPDLLRGLPELRMLALSYNQLITVHGLFAEARPRFIVLDHNNLTDADDILHEDMTGVETIQLNDNPISQLSEVTFNTKIPNVRFIYLDHCLLKDLDVRHYLNLSHLALLTLDENFIEHVPEQVIGFGYNTQIMLTYNQISSFKASITRIVKCFSISGNRMTELGPMFQYTNITELEINDNELAAVTDFNFKGMVKIENLDLRRNLISRIDTDAFSWTRNSLQNLDLSSNRLTSLNGSMRFLSTLKAMNVSNNNIEVIRQGEFFGLNELSELYMQHNKIVALPGELQRIPELQYLIMQHNRIRNVDVQDLPTSLKFFYFRNNPISCDCNFLPFLQWLKEPNSPKSDVLYCQGGRNDKPISIYPDFRHCPENCKCSCQGVRNNTFLSVDCSSRNIIGPPGLFRSEADDVEGMSQDPVQSMIVRQNADPRFVIVDKVMAINLQHNKIRKLDDWNFPTQLKALQLADNDLTRLPSSVVDLPALGLLSLSENPWTCDCEAKDFSAWLISKTEMVVDVNDTRCSSEKSHALNGKMLINLSERDLCPVPLSIYIPVGFSALVVLLLGAALAILYTQYQNIIRSWLYSKGFKWVKKDFQEDDKIFDAFISFSQKDHDLVHDELVPGIEARLKNIRLCLHYRNFPAGEYIYTNIINAVHCSKITVLIFSKYFLESQWCRLEFRAACTKALEDNVHKVIAIRVGELPEIKDPAIKAFLNKVTYLTWGEKFFWQTLVYALPTPDNMDVKELVL